MITGQPVASARTPGEHRVDRRVVDAERVDWDGRATLRAYLDSVRLAPRGAAGEISFVGAEGIAPEIGERVG